MNAMNIRVYRTIKTVLHRITLRHEYAVITTQRSINDPKKFGLIRLISSDDPSQNCFIYIGRPVYSRERFDQNECLAEILKKFPLLKDDEVSFPDINELYHLAEGKIIEINVEGNDLKTVNHNWICECLQFKDSEREDYLNDDFTSVKVTLSRIAGRTVRQADEAPVPVDAGCFEVYDRMIDVFAKIDISQAYGDACSIEYSIISEGYEYRFFITHFFSNHNWALDPQNLLNVCFSAEVLSGSCSKESVRFSHPSQITSHKSDGDEYLVETITMDNNKVSAKFGTSGSEDVAEGDVSVSRTYDNPVDLAMWVDLYYQEIRMA